jgi:uncharacterized membrane protein
MLSQMGTMSWFSSYGTHAVSIAYQVVTALACAGLVAWGIRHDERAVMLIAVAGAVMFLFLRLADWFWDLVPQWLFFLLIAGFALGVLAVLRRLRLRRAVEAP